MATVTGTMMPPPMTRATRVKRYLRSKWFAYACIAPIVVATAVLIYYPLIVGIYYSFTNASGTNPNNVGIPFLNIPPTFKFVGLKNFFDIFANSDPTVDVRLIFLQTLEWIAFNAVLHFSIGLGLALLLNRKIRFRGVYRALLIVPWATPQFVAAFGWRFLFNGDYGFINLLLERLHLVPIDWTGQPAAAMAAVIICNVWLGIPFMTITLLGGLQSIPNELYEVAELDGANWWQRFLNVTLPLLRPTAVLVTMLDVIWTFNVFAIIFLITGGGPYHRSDTFVSYAFQVAIINQKYGLGAAYGVIILLILVGFVMIYSRLLRANEQVY
jgi:arabinogalactan oligomer / maltooligosaccharide transport system permease protein